jgi:MFS family permease
LFWICIPIQEFFLALLGPTAMGFLSNAVKDQDQGKLMGIMQSVGAVGLAVAPLLGGLIAGINYDAHILFGGSIILLFSFIILFGYRAKIFIKKI